MGASGVDVKLSTQAFQRFPFNVECKNQEVNRGFIKMWEQATANTDHDGRTLLVLSANHSPTLAVLKLEDLVRICSERSEV